MFTDRVKRLRIPFSSYLYHLHRFKEVNLPLLNYYELAWRTCECKTLKNREQGDWEPKYYFEFFLVLCIALKY